MASYFVNFQNNTNVGNPSGQTWYLGVYQVYPPSPGLLSVSWLQTGVPPGGFGGVSWSIDYNVALSTYNQSSGVGVYTSSQVLPAALGDTWQIVDVQGIQQLQFVSHNSVGPEQISIQNNSSAAAFPGIGMSGSASAYQTGQDNEGVLIGTDANFVVTPTYWAALFSSVQLGEVISSDISATPFQLVFQNGNNAATITATMAAGQFNQSLVYSQQSSTPSSTLSRRLAGRRPARLAGVSSSGLGNGSHGQVLTPTVTRPLLSVE